MESLSIHRFFAPNSISFQHLVLLIRNERCRELVFISKRLLRPWRVGRNTEDRSLDFGKCPRKPRKVDRLLGAPWCVRARIEKNYYLLPRIVREGNGAAAVARQMEGGRLGSFAQHTLVSSRRVIRCSRRFVHGWFVGAFDCRGQSLCWSAR